MPRRDLKGVPVLAGVAAKAGKLVAVLKLSKFTGVFVTATSMLISTLAYDFFIGPWVAIGLVSLLFVHEMGHVFAIRAKGMPTRLPVFIPFLGAAIFTPNMGDRDTEAFIGYGGPFLGSIAAWLAVIAWAYTGDHILWTIAFFGVYLNLFNLIPIQPFDGGRILQVVGNQIKYIGLLVLVAYTIFLAQPGLLVLWVLVLTEFRDLPLWWRPIITAMITSAMVALVGYSDQPWFIDFFDLLIGAFFTMMFVQWDIRTAATRLERERLRLPPQERSDPRPYPAWNLRLRWLAAYVALGVALCCTMVYMLDRVPTP